MEVQNQDRISEIQQQLEGIGESLGDISVDLLRSAVEAGENKRPEYDKKLAQARRAVEKAIRCLE